MTAEDRGRADIDRIMEPLKATMFATVTDREGNEFPPGRRDVP
ncbi:hypothetical protein [Streptomyces sp. NPDC057740]